MKLLNNVHAQYLDVVYSDLLEGSVQAVEHRQRHTECSHGEFDYFCESCKPAVELRPFPSKSCVALLLLAPVITKVNIAEIESASCFVLCKIPAP